MIPKRESIPYQPPAPVAEIMQLLDRLGYDTDRVGTMHAELGATADDFGCLVVKWVGRMSYRKIRSMKRTLSAVEPRITA